MEDVAPTAEVSVNEERNFSTREESEFLNECNDDANNGDNINKSDEQMHQGDDEEVDGEEHQELFQEELISDDSNGIVRGERSEQINDSEKGERKVDRKLSVYFDEKPKIECDVEVTELLGSVHTQSCHGTRTSARVIQKMKQDQVRPTTPPLHERENTRKDEKGMQKTPSQLRTNKPNWTNLERNHFFDALNEFGKDFEAIGNYINSKLKRKSTTDFSFKTKDQVRQHYYQTYHKICKYLKFSDEVKRPVQELYALINYGEMRRKLQFVTDKHFMKLRNLVYQGYITVRCKGKNIRIKTPSCKALRRINQLDDSLEDVRLPAKIEVIVNPSNMESFGRVQALAQNPRVRTTVPLHKKLANFIATFQFKWRSPDAKLIEEQAKLFPDQQQQQQQQQQQITQSSQQQQQQQHHQSNETPADKIDSQDKSSTPLGFHDPEMCFLPRPGVTISRPLLSITEYLSNVNICLNAYEERIGVRVRGESLCHDRHVPKRQRTDSGSEKRSPDHKKSKQFNSPTHDKEEESDLHCSDLILPQFIAEQDVEALQPKSESSSDELSDEVHELLSDTDAHLNEMNAKLDAAACNEYASSSSITTTHIASSTNASSYNISDAQSALNAQCASNMRSAAKRGNNPKTTRPAAPNFKPLVNDAVIRRIRKGWTISNAADITIGDLYVVLGQDSKLELDYYWTGGNSGFALGAEAAAKSALAATDSASSVFLQKLNGMPYNPNADPKLLKRYASASVGNKLKHLLLIANLSERIRKRQCACVHTCERPATKARFDRDFVVKTATPPNKKFIPMAGTDPTGVFRQPAAPLRRPVLTLDPVKQMAALTRQKMSRQVLVQRLILPSIGNNAAPLKDSEKNAPKSNENSTDAVATSSGNSSMAAGGTADADNNGTSEDKTATETNSSTAVNTSDATSNTFMLPFESVEGMAANQLSDDLVEDMLEQQNEYSMPNTFTDSSFDETSNLSNLSGINPMHLLRDSTSTSRWLEENLNDYSLTSLLGHLDEINAGRDILDPSSSNLSVFSESSVDFVHKFEEITALMQGQEKDL